MLGLRLSILPTPVDGTEVFLERKWKYKDKIKKPLSALAYNSALRVHVAPLAQKEATTVVIVIALGSFLN